VFWYYRENPGFVGQLGLLTALVSEKYPHTAAIDIGANVGDTACIIKTAADIPLLCIEGDDKSFDFLQRNVAQFQNTTAHKLFLAERTDTISASLACAGWNTTILPGSTASAKAIQVMRFDDFIVTQPGWENFKLLKIDTEGFDCPIIRGATKFIRQVLPVIFFEYNRQSMALIGEPGIDTLFMLAELGYSHIAFHDARGRFICSANLADREKIRDLHDYADGKNSEIYYLDITVFHERDTDIALKYLAAERTRRRGSMV
jgi:FkbM family methyltransferase